MYPFPPPAAELPYNGGNLSRHRFTMPTPSTVIHTDIAILGGGIAGLWLLNRLVDAGYQAVLLEANALGQGQTIASQGMVHGGIKYALSGALSGASEAVAAMPAHWKRCLAGEGDLDLRGVDVLSEDFFLWTAPGIGASLTGFLASRSLRGRVDAVEGQARPQPLQDKRYKGSVYRLQDVVLDVPSLLGHLAGRMAGRIHRIDARALQWQRQADGQQQLSLGDGLQLSAQRFVLTAGEGNEALLKALGSPQPAMQRRPLQQVLVKHDYPHPLYGHCIAMSANASPRLTLSSHRAQDGRWVWYLGGDLATEGTDLPPEQLIDRARKELKELLGWIDLGRTEWATIKLDRAEPRQRQLVKPDQAFAELAEGSGNVLAAWPTKLTLAPNLAEEVFALLQRDGIRPQASPAALPLLAPAVAAPPWHTLFG